MIKKALYRKYRPNDFDEIVGQDSVVKTIKNALKNDSVSHAYLFCGPRGTGKTTLAKLIAKTVNCLNYPIDQACNECNICKLGVNNQDVVEIDAASNNGVDEIREIRDKVSFLPTNSRYKIYIIDEVHMLTTGAFNALLKTLEEPPSHVIFVLATTEPYRIPNTIISRCQRFDLKRINIKDIVKKLKYICENEKIEIEEEALQEIARLSDGGLRDAINMLDQLISYSEKKIELKDVDLLSGRVGNKELEELFLLIIEKDPKKCLKYLNDLIDDGRDVIKIAEGIMEFLKNLLISEFIEEIVFNKKVKDELKKEFIFLVIEDVNKKIIDMKNCSNPRILLELILLKIIDIYDESSVKNIPQFVDEKPKNTILNEDIEKPVVAAEKEKTGIIDVKEDKTVQKPEPIISDSEIIVNLEKMEELKKIRINNSLAGADKDELAKIKERWIELASYSIDPFLGPAAGLLLDGNVRVAGKENILISYAYPAMVDRINGSLLKAENLLNDLMHNAYKIIAVTEEEWIKIRDVYVGKVRKNEKYQKIAEDIDIDKDVYIKKTTKKEKKSVKAAIDLFGENIIEIR